MVIDMNESQLFISKDPFLFYKMIFIQLIYILYLMSGFKICLIILKVYNLI